jgi:hypothetical protein
MHIMKNDRITLKQATVIEVMNNRVEIRIDGGEHNTFVRHDNIASVETRPLRPGNAIMKRKPRSVRKYIVIAVHGDLAWISTDGNPPSTHEASSFENID